LVSVLAFLHEKPEEKQDISAGCTVLVNVSIYFFARAKPRANIR
jgi:hypothetical protein